MKSFQRFRLNVTFASLAVRLVVVASFLQATLSLASDLEAFTEPYHRIDVPAAETGTIEQIMVREGDEVTRRQLLAKLDDRVLQSSLELARVASQAMGAKLAAEADWNVRRQQWDSYQALNKNGNATPRELQRSEGELQQATARLQSIREDIDVRRLELERVKTQIAMRRVESPIDGFVVAIKKDAGEYVSPHDPVVMQIVHLKSLKANFSVPIAAAKSLTKGQIVSLAYGSNNETCDGVIEFVSPIADPESASVSVKIRIDNSAARIPCGVVCTWNLNSEAPATRTTQRNLDPIDAAGDRK